MLHHSATAKLQALCECTLCSGIRRHDADGMCAHLRSLVDEADAATARLRAGKTYKRPQIWEVEENVDRLQGIGSTDR